MLDRRVCDIECLIRPVKQQTKCPTLKAEAFPHPSKKCEQMSPFRILQINRDIKGFFSDPFCELEKITVAAYFFAVDRNDFINVRRNRNQRSNLAIDQKGDPCLGIAFANHP